MFCSKCGKEMEGQMLFCPACGAPVKAADGVETADRSQAQSGQGVYVEQDFDVLRQMTEKRNMSARVWKIIGRIAAVVYALLAVRALFRSMESVLNGNAGIASMIPNICVLVIFACMLLYIFWEICMPFVMVKRMHCAEEYLKYIHSESSEELLKAVSRMNCPAVKEAYIDENGNVRVRGKKCTHTFSVVEETLTLASAKKNYKTALERETIAGSLLKSLAPNAPVNAYETARMNDRLSKMNPVLAVLAALSMAVFAFFQLNPQLMVGSQQYIDAVKSGHPQIYPDISYGEAFDAFFSDCHWEYFKSTEDQDVVEFQGTCSYEGLEAKVLIQFLLSDEDDSMELYAMEINGEPQSDLMMSLLVANIFESYQAGSTGELESVDDSGDVQDTADPELAKIPEISDETEESETGKEPEEPMEEAAEYESAPEEQDLEQQEEGFATPVMWETLSVLAGLWSDESCDVSMSIYSEAESYGEYEEIGSFCVEQTGAAGVILLEGERDGELYVLCVADTGEDMELCYKNDGTVEVLSVTGELGVNAGAKLSCMEHFDS